MATQNQNNGFTWSTQQWGNQAIQQARLIGVELKSVEKAFEKIIEDRMNDAVQVKFLPLDSQGYGIPLDVMVVSVDVAGKYMASYALGVSDGKKNFGMEEGQLGNERYSVPNVPAMTFRTDNMAKIIEITKKHYKMDVMMCGSAVLPLNDLNLDNENNTTVALAAVYDCLATIVNTAEGARPLNVTQANDNEYLVTKREHGVSNIHDEFASPLRADLITTLTAVPSNNNDMRAMSSGAEICQSTAFVDMLPYVSQNGQAALGQSGPFTQAGVQNVNTNIEIANIVFTSVTPGVSQSASNMLLGFATAMDAFNNQHYWASTLNPFKQPNGNMHSMRGLGYEISERFRHMNIPFAALPIGQEAFTEREWLEVLNKYVSPDVAFSFDVALGSPSSWRYRFLTDAAKETREQALKEDSFSANILRLADELTGFNFSKIYLANGGNGQPVSRLENRWVLIGSYYNAELKEQRDIRDIDRMFLLSNVVQDDVVNMDTVRRWTAAQTDASLSITQRLHIQSQILKRVVPSAKIDDYGIRYDFDGIFVKSLLEALAAAAFQTTYNDISNDVWQTSQNATYIQRAITSRLGVTMMHNGYNNSMGGNNNFSGNW